MKKILLGLLLFLIFVFPVEAFEFVKNSNNPLNITYLNDYAYPFNAHIYKEDNRCKGILTTRRPTETYYSLVAIESEDCFNWMMTKEILNIGQDISNPRLFINTDGTKKIYFTKTDGKDFYRIYSTDCDNNLNCSSDVNLVLDPNPSDLTERNGYFASYVIKIDTHYYMFYGVWGKDGFKIRMAYSDSLESWQKCPDNLISDGSDGPFPYLENNNLYLFFHKSNSSGIKLAKTSLPLSCDSIFEDLGYQLTPNQSSDVRHLVFPSVVQEDTGLKLYYSGADWNWNWSLNLACTGGSCISSTPTPTFSPTPTLTPTQTPTPIKTPIIIIPGFMASWNKDAILHNQSVSQSDWKLASFVKEYKGLINTLKNLGYEENKNLFVFAYDWRKPLLNIVDDFNNYLNNLSINNLQFSIVGHSLGGLVGRIFAQKNKSQVNRIITVGSPHQGVVQVYKPLEGGEIDRDNTFLWLAEKIILFLNKSTVESDRVTIANKFPVAKDLFPTFSFLKDLSGKEIPIENMSVKNSLLFSYNQNFSDIFPLFTAIYGEKDKNTPAGFIIEPQNSLDLLLGNYSDGKPKESYFDLGDYMVLSNSARQDTDSEKLNFDHGEIITKKEPIKKILSLLNINFSDEQIVEGQITKISPSLIFLIKSPATMKVEFNNNTYIENDGIIFIPDAQSGNYYLKVQGVDQGEYEVIIGQISENNDLWENIKGEIVQAPTDFQIDSYSIDYNNQTAVSMFPTPTSAPTATPTPIPTESPTIIPALTPTTIPQTINLSSSTNSSSDNQPVQSSNNEIPLSKESAPSVLGISSDQEELITPTPEIIKEINENKIINKTSIWKKIFPTVISLLIAITGWIFRKKIFKNE